VNKEILVRCVRLLPLLLVLVLPAGSLSVICGGCSRKVERWNLILMTLDTTRRDRLSCYGYPLSTSPAIDRLAARGILFERAVAPTPITLPSHSTILTGLDPFEHGVRNNNAFVLAEDHTTVAEALREEGYATGATLGAFPVDARFGLNQGFQTYDDQFDYTHRLAGLRMTQRSADAVTSKALAWIEMNRKSPFFHWVHYFDPHFPYEPPEELRRRFEHPYDGEIAFMDGAIGRLVAGLERLGLTEKTWILIVGDHGESLDEHGELNHSMLIYGATQSVPCILVPPEKWQRLEAAQARGRRITPTVRLKDLAPTMIDALDLDPGRIPASGESLLPLVAGAREGPGAAYMETLAPSLEYGWSDLRGLRTDRWSYIRAPTPELYDLEQDPGEIRNLYETRPEIVERLTALCDAVIRDEVALDLEQQDFDTLRKLRALGYIATPLGTTGPTSSDEDPKELMHLFDKINEARTTMGLGRAIETRRLLDEVLQEDPDNPQATRLLGDCLLALGDNQRAIEIYRGYSERFPEDTQALVNLAQARAILGAFDDALRLVEGILEGSPLNEEAGDLYPRLLVQAGRADAAERYLDQSLDRFPDEAAFRVRAAEFELFRKNRAAAEAYARKALEHDPGHAGGHAIMGEVLYLQGVEAFQSNRRDAATNKIAEARRHFDLALQRDPLQSLAAFRLASIDHDAGRLQEARDLFFSALNRRPNWPEAHARLATVLWQRKEIRESLVHYGQAASLGFNNPGFLANYGQILVQLGEKQKAIAIFEKALEAAPPRPLAEQVRSSLDKLLSDPSR